MKFPSKLRIISLTFEHELLKHGNVLWKYQIKREKTLNCS